MLLFKPIEERCDSASTPCRIRLSDVTDFEWDHAGFVRMQAPPPQAAAALGVRSLSMPEFEDWIVFVKGGEVVKVDKRPYHPERPFDRTVFLDFAGSKDRWRIFARSEATFDVEISQSGALRNILLRATATGGTPPADPR